MKPAYDTIHSPCYDKTMAAVDRYFTRNADLIQRIDAEMNIDLPESTRELLVDVRVHLGSSALDGE